MTHIKALRLVLSMLILVNGAFAANRPTMRHKPGVTFKILYSFDGGTADGGEPDGQLINDEKGNLYGMLAFGCAYNQGGVFKLTKHNGTYSLSLLHSFNGNDGTSPDFNQLILKNHILYGVTSDGQGTGGQGSIFSMGTDGSNFTTLYKFSGGNDGGVPYGGLLMDTSGNLYGTTNQGGTVLTCADGCGTVFKYSKGTLTTLVNFNLNNGARPYAGLNMDSHGNLWGTATYGGSYGYGVVFELKPAGGGGWKFSVVHNFSGNRGAYPRSSAVFARGDTLFGTTIGDSSENCLGYGCGVVYGLAEAGEHKETIAHRFSGGRDGGNPIGRVEFNKVGHLFGTTFDDGKCSVGCGTVFELKQTGGVWRENVLHSFDGTDGCQLFSGVVLDKNGNAFGTAAHCGSGGFGVVYELSGVQ
jgi:uncharacterized repeat protein (TIGR03803 family)